MSRWATMLSLGGVTGFCLASAFRIVSQATVPTLSSSLMSPDPAIAVSYSESIGYAALLAALGVGSAAAIVSIAVGSASGKRAARLERQIGERYAGATLIGLVAFYAATTAIQSPVSGLFGAGPGFLVLMALAFAALLFDRLMEVDDDEEGDAAFESALESIRRAERAELQENWHACAQDVAAQRRERRIG